MKEPPKMLLESVGKVRFSLLSQKGLEIQKAQHSITWHSPTFRGRKTPGVKIGNRKTENNDGIFKNRLSVVNSNPDKSKRKCPL